MVLITHQLQFIKSADKLLLLKNGRTEVYGSYEHLLSKGVDFMKFNPILTEGTTDSGMASSVSSASLESNSSNAVAPSVTVGKSDLFRPSLDPIPNSEFTISSSGTPESSPVVKQSLPQLSQQTNQQSVHGYQGGRKSDTDGPGDLPVIAPGASGGGYRQFQRAISRQSSRMSIPIRSVHPVTCQCPISPLVPVTDGNNYQTRCTSH